MGIGVVSYRNISSNRTPIGYASSWKSSFDDVGLLNRDYCQLLPICYAKLCYVCFISLRSPSNFRGFLLDVLWGHFYNDRFLTNSSWHSSYLIESSREKPTKQKPKTAVPPVCLFQSETRCAVPVWWLGLWINDNLIRPFCLTIWKWVHWFFKQWTPGALDIDTPQIFCLTDGKSSGSLFERSNVGEAGILPTHRRTDPIPASALPSLRTLYYIP